LEFALVKKTILEAKQILAVDDEEDVLDILQEELEDYGAIVDKATSHEVAIEKLSSLTYDLAILDIMGVRGFDLLRVAAASQIPVVMLTAHALNPDTLKKSIALGARAYLPKNQLGRVAAFLEDVLTLSYHSAWHRTLTMLKGHFGKRYGPRWRKTEKEFWDQVEQEVELKSGAIITS
jgi:CheY-like chemotaxis protein